MCQLLMMRLSRIEVLALKFSIEQLAVRMNIHFIDIMSFFHCKRRIIG